MRTATIALLLGFVQITAAASQATNPYLGRWDLTFTPPADAGWVGNGGWLGVGEKDGKLEVLFQGYEGHVAPVESFDLRGAHMSVVVNKATERSPAMTLELDVAGGKITGVQKRRNQTVPLVGVPAPDLKRSAPAAWTDPVPLFNGKNLDGWEAVNSATAPNWAVKDGELVIVESGVNIRTTRKFDAFKLHFEVTCPQRGSSGFYLRGRYELNISGGPGSPASPASPPEAKKGPARAGGGGLMSSPNRAMGAIYGRLAPSSVPSTPPDGWDKFDVTMVGRTVTIVRNGVTTIDQKEIEGITGDALDSNEGEPGAFYIQGDHSGNVKFRNITVSVPKR
jgi:hypothetical protein